MIIREDICLFDPDLLAEFRDGSWDTMSPERERLLAALRQSAEAEGWGEESIELGFRALEYDTGNWPGYGDPALVAPFLDPATLSEIVSGEPEQAIQTFLEAVGIAWSPGGAPALDGLPHDVWGIAEGMIEPFRELGAVGAVHLELDGPDRVEDWQANIYVARRNANATVETAAARAGIAITGAAEADLAVLERMTEAGMVAMRTEAESNMTAQRYQNLGLGVFRAGLTWDLPPYAKAIALREAMALGALPEEGRAFRAGGVPWPPLRLRRGLDLLGALRTHLIRGDARPPAAVLDVAPVFGGGTVEVVGEDEAPAPPRARTEGRRPAEDGPAPAAPGAHLDGAPEEGPMMPLPEEEAPALPPIGSTEGAVVEVLDAEGQVVEETAPPPPPPEPMLMSGREMAEAGSAASLENMMRVIGRAISRETVLRAPGDAVPINLEAAAAWCSMQCVDAIVRILPAQIREGELPAQLSRFAAAVLGLLLVAEQAGFPAAQLGRPGSRRIKAKFPLLSSRPGRRLECYVGVWTLKVLERAALMGSPMLAFASEKKLAEIGEDDPGGFMGELAQLAQAARSLEPPAVTNSKKLSALQQFFNNN
jgi:hypothetical protein